MKNILLKTVLIVTLFISFSFTNIPVEEENHAVVSWYGPGFHGKLTASGQVYNMNDYTCAHKTLKFGTKVKFTNPKNGKSVIAKVNDRGPFIKGRTFDLSKATFNAISNTDRGVIKIKYKIIK